MHGRFIDLIRSTVHARSLAKHCQGQKEIYNHISCLCSWCLCYTFNFCWFLLCLKSKLRTMFWTGYQVQNMTPRQVWFRADHVRRFGVSLLAERCSLCPTGALDMLEHQGCRVFFCESVLAPEWVGVEKTKNSSFQQQLGRPDLRSSMICLVWFEISCKAGLKNLKLESSAQSLEPQFVEPQAWSSFETPYGSCSWSTVEDWYLTNAMMSHMF